MSSRPQRIHVYDPFAADAAVNVRDYGARGDGSALSAANERVAVSAAFADAVARGIGTVYFPAGTYDIRAVSYNVGSNLHIQGAGIGVTKIITSAVGAAIFQCDLSLWAQNIRFSDMTIGPGASGGIGIAIAGGNVSNVTVERCRFEGMGIYADGASDVLVSDNAFHGLCRGTAIGFQAVNSGRRIELTRNRFLYCLGGAYIITSGSNDSSEWCEISGNYFDGGWWSLPSDYSGSGGTVTYASTTVTDSGAAFSGITAGAYVRAMPVLRSGTASTITGQKLTDGSANFVSANVKRGHIVRSGSAFAIVGAVESATVLVIEEWLSDTDRTAITPPTAGAYTVYGRILGSVTSHTGTVVTVARWFDAFDGSSSTPSNGTRYEVARVHPEYNVFLGNTTQSVLVHRNRIRRGWSDQVGLFGSECIVTSNLIDDGQDMGITVSAGARNIVSGNRIVKNGANNICIDGAHDTVAIGNVCVDAYIANIDTETPTSIRVENGSRNTVTANHCEKVNSANLLFAGMARSDGTATADNVFSGNRSKNISSGSPWIARGPLCDNTHFLDNDGGTPTTDGGATNTKQNAALIAV